MTTFYTHPNSTTARRTYLPSAIDLSTVDSITVHVDEQSVGATVVDQSANAIGIPFAELTLSPNTTYEVSFELQYSDGTVDYLPRDGYDLLTVTDNNA